MSDRRVREEVERVEMFINDVLREDLRLVDQQLQSVSGDLLDTQQQRRTLALLAADGERSDREGFKTQVNVGCDVMVEGRVRDTARCLLDVGLQHYVELTPREADGALAAREAAGARRAGALRARAAATRAHIKLLLLGLSQLRGTAHGHT